MILNPLPWEERPLGVSSLGLSLSKSRAGVRRATVARRSLAPPKGAHPRHAFTLLEVIIASAIFFMVAFAILGTVAQCLSAARKLEQRDPDPALIATQFAVTNIISEGSDSGDFEQSYPGLFPGWSWTVDKYPVYGETNGIYQVDILVFRDSPQGRAARSLSIQIFAPQSLNANPGRF